MKYKFILLPLIILVLFSCKKEDEIKKEEILDHNPGYTLLTGFHPESGLPLICSDTVINDSLYGIGIHFKKNNITNKKLTRFKAYIHVHGYSYNQNNEPVYFMLKDIAMIDSTICEDEFTMYFDGYFNDYSNAMIFYLFFIYDEGSLNNSVNLKLYCDHWPK